jgi:ABC-type bacteriocin/lantibiotic exporter with double-glycine peptidase domain
MPNTLLPVPHYKQQQTADCLAACAAMILAHWGIAIEYERLLTLLKVKSFGTAGANLNRLSVLGIQVIYREGSIEELKVNLERGLPSIILVRTADLPYWGYSTDHAVVVTGFDEQFIYLNDPAFETYPIAVSLVQFELAWMVFDYRYGLIMP